MEHLPDDIPPLVAGYLPPLDAIKLGRTSRTLRSQLSLTDTRHRILTSFVRHNRDGDRHHGFEIPIASSVAVHSVRVSLRRKDQRWGIHSGRVWVAAAQEGARARDGSGRERGPFSHGRFVCSPGVAPRDAERLSLTFRPRRNESYHLWYVGGGGGELGGRSLSLSDVDVHTLVFDDKARSSEKAHALIVRSDVLHPFDVMGPQVQFHHDTWKAILANTSHALARGLQASPLMISFFGSYGISSADLSVELLKLVESVWSDWERGLSIYTDTDHNRNGREELSDGEYIFHGMQAEPPLFHTHGGDVVTHPRHRRFFPCGRLFG